MSLFNVVLRRPFAWALVLPAIAVLSGCDSRSPSEPRRRGPATQTGAQSGLFDSVAENLDRLEQFDTEQILKQVGDRLNQWYLQDKPSAPWQPDPLLDELPEALRNQVDVQGLETVRFQTPDDGWFLQEAVWLRNLSSNARSDQFQDLAVAQRLFDWTVRNIQLTVDPPVGAAGRPHRPYETLLYGRGTAIERAWVFILLARQQGLDVVFLGIADDQGQTVRPWLPALVLGDDLYLFDTHLGLPIPGPEPGSVATLAQVAADDELLRRLDLDQEHPYPVRAEDLKHVVAYVEASPPSLSKRMALVEARLAGKHKMRLTSPGSALAERVKSLPHVAEVELWPMPFEVYSSKAVPTREQQRAAAMYQSIPTLKRGRALHFKGEYEGEQGAKGHYLNARPPDSYIEAYHLPPELAQRVPRDRISQVEATQVVLMTEGKQNASYWLGLIFFEQEDYSNAIDFFGKRTLETGDKNPWSAAARYNLARSYEAAGERDKAIELLSSDTDSPQSHGNRLRARWLAEE